MNSRVITRIKKRDGEIVDFTQDKITNAIFKAMKSQGIDDYSQAKTVSDIVTFVLEDKFGGYTVPSVEQIQDMVEHVLMKRGYLEVAKSYILYRERHKSIREAKQTG
ncbi:MAG: ribonucleoside triphosphate reductase, partial [Acidobacteria bacterium]|nr:ribonucleoside triphosphate reductase [Acidobacteriota bacterium]